MYTGVYEPLCRLLASHYPIHNSYPMGTSRDKYAGTPIFNYAVDLPAGKYPFRTILDYCCAQNPDQVFAFTPFTLRNGAIGGVSASVLELNYSNPLAPPRTPAVAYWETEMARPRMRRQAMMRSGRR